VKIGIGIPNAVPRTPGSTLIEWAKRAEDRGFHALATIDRFAYPTNDALTTLAAAGAVTSRIGLLTDILLAPAYEPVHLAKVSATVDQLSNGRLTLGWRPAAARTTTPPLAGTSPGAGPYSTTPSRCSARPGAASPWAG
jgi:alkanesulfonate monooxygenase SsuD/methylene tetrahydromethanopterin reductase-like flavin-dependent oxidoreductase (luciferase family)